MREIILRGLAAALATTFALTFAAAPALKAQQRSSVSPALAAKGEWDAGTTYAKDDIVTARGSSWISLVNGNLNKVPGQTQPSTAAFWELFARGLNPAGAWSNATKYQPDDLVTRSGQTYRAKLTNTNKPPANTTFWELLAKRGEPGPNTGIDAGSQSTPAISFNGDSDTGIYSPAAGKIAIVEDGALFLHNLGNSNTALGVQALSALTTGSSNTAMGQSALLSNTTGTGNTAVGALALKFNTTGGNNTAVGLSTLFANTTGGANTGVGLSALNANTTGTNNTAVGTSALVSNTSGGASTAIGSQALRNATSGGGNTALGFEALFNNTAGVNNTAVGTEALSNNTTGANNIAIGAVAGTNATAPSNSIFIGNSGAAADSNTIKIGTGQASTFIAGIRGKTTTNNDAVAVLIDSAGQLGTASSSRRYKYDIETMADVSAMLAKLRPVTFRYKKAQDGGQHPLQYGLIAEEVADIFPGLAVFKDGEPETVKYHLLPSFLLAGYQAQQKTIAAQAEKIAAQAQDIAALRERLRRIEAVLPGTRAGLK